MFEKMSEEAKEEQRLKARLETVKEIAWLQHKIDSFFSNSGMEDEEAIIYLESKLDRTEEEDVLLSVLVRKRECQDFLKLIS